MKIKYKLSAKQRCYLLDQVIDASSKRTLNVANLVWSLKDHCLPLMGCDFTQDQRPIDERQKMDEFGSHCKNIAGLGLSLKLLGVEEKRIYQEPPLAPYTLANLKATWLGRLYRRCPTCLKIVTLLVGQFILATIQAVQKYKWVTAFASFGVLATKVWQSGVIDKAWIAISAVVGLAVAWLLSLWR